MNRFTRTMIVAVPILTGAALQRAQADVVVIVSANSAATKLTTEDIARIYLGRSNRMKPLDIAEPSNTRHVFYAKVMGRNDAQVKAVWSKLVFAGRVSIPKELSATEVVKSVAADPNAIGYVDRSFVNLTVKIVYVVE